MARPFLLLEPGPLVPDEPHQRGDGDLLEINQLSNIAGHVLGGRMMPGDYQSRVLCLTDWRRKGEDYDLTPLAKQFPSSSRPAFKALSADTFERSFGLAPGGMRLSEAEKGDILQTNLGGFGTQSTAGGAGAPAAQPGMPRGPAGGTAAKAPVIKLRVKASKGAKRRREGSEQAS